jgi:hypothetical protein
MPPILYKFTSYAAARQLSEIVQLNYLDLMPLTILSIYSLMNRWVMTSDHFWRT